MAYTAYPVIWQFAVFKKSFENVCAIIFTYRVLWCVCHPGKSKVASPVSLLYIYLIFMRTSTPVPLPPLPVIFFGSKCRASFSHRETHSSAFSYRNFRDTLDVSSDVELTRNFCKCLSKLWEIVEDRRAWHAAIHGVAQLDTTQQINNNNIFWRR